MFRSLIPYERPDKVIPRGFEAASQSLRNDGTPGFSLLLNVFLGALNDAITGKESSWVPKGDPNEVGNYFYKAEIIERLPKLLACGAAIEALDQFQESMYNEKTEKPNWSKRPDDGKTDGLVVVPTMLFLTMSIWESLPELEAILRPLRQKGLVQQEVVDELSEVLLDYLSLTKARISLPNGRLPLQQERLDKLDDFLSTRGDIQNNAKSLASEFVDALRGQVVQLMKPVELEG